jgi:PKHD-type hydroxylase
MFLELPDLLTAGEVAELNAIAARARWTDGRASNPHSTVKANEILADPQAHSAASRIMLAGFARSEAFRDFAFPATVASPLLTRYAAGWAQAGGRYGLHADAAFMAVGDKPLRADLSATIFLTDPAAYDGGELAIELGAKRLATKLPAGAAIVYPSTTLHEVTPVTRGARLVGLTFIQSRIADQWRRELLYELNEVVALEGLRMDPANFTRAQRVQQALQRLWFDR